MSDGTLATLVTGATGKVGQCLIERYLAERPVGTIRALCHNRTIEASERIEVVRGTISDRDVVRRAMEGVTHVVHLATCKEIPEQVMDVTVKGLFWMLEEARESKTLRRFILIGGDAAIGHFDYPREAPVTETGPFMAYEGCYALSKVIEETMLRQYQIQYGLDGCCLRAPWIMEKDDFRCAHTFGEDVFGGPRWCDEVDPAAAKRHADAGAVPVMLDAEGRPMRRNFVHVTDLVSAIIAALDHPAARRQLFHIAMNEPVDYGKMGDYLASTRNLEVVRVATPYFSTWFDNAKARLMLGWAPEIDLERLIDLAWNYQRAPDDPRVTWYPG